MASYFIYGKFIERISGVDETRQTPAFKLQDGVDYVPMSKFKNYLVHFLNIAGLGPIFGAIQVRCLDLWHSYGLLWVQFSLGVFMTFSQDSCP